MKLKVTNLGIQALTLENNRVDKIPVSNNYTTYITLQILVVKGLCLTLIPLLNTFESGILHVIKSSFF